MDLIGAIVYGPVPSAPLNRPDLDFLHLLLLRRHGRLLLQSPFPEEVSAGQGALILIENVNGGHLVMLSLGCGPCAGGLQLGGVEGATGASVLGVGLAGLRVVHGGVLYTHFHHLRIYLL